MYRSFSICLIARTSKTLSFIVAIGFAINVYGQTIQYSRQNFKAPAADAMQLVTGISGKHHVLCFRKNENIFLYVYNDELQLLSRKEVQIKLQENDDVNVIPFSSFYFLYIHQQGSSKHELWKIDAEGNSTSLTQPFAGLIDTVFKKNTVTFQLLNKNHKLCIIANTYYDELKKVCSTVAEADEKLSTIVFRRVFFGFKKYEENLLQVTPAGHDLLILKTSRDSGDHLLQILKANLNTGDILSRVFNSGSNSYSNPTFNYNQADSSIIVYSMIKKTFFITKLGYLLNEKVPVTLLKNQFRNNTAFNFLLLQGQSRNWIRLYNQNDVYRYQIGRTAIYPSRINSSSRFNSGFGTYGNPGFNSSSDYVYSRQSSSGMPSPYPSASNYNDRYNDASAIRFSLLNTDFTLSKDSVAANDKSNHSIDPRRFSNVVLQNKNYLFLGQQFGTNRQGLLMVYSEDNGELVMRDIRVYDKHEYLLRQLQVAGNKSVILPYTYKRELGLVKITLE